MLANALPKDYVIYVKEHPNQFFIYENDKYAKGFLSNINYFRDLAFYWQLKQIPNVKIIDINIPSIELIKKAQATACICGSVTVESVLNKKPILIFGNSLNFVELLKDSFKIRSQNDIKNALDKIEQGFIPKYDDFNEVVNEYCFMQNTLDKNFFISIFKNLLKSD